MINILPTAWNDTSMRMILAALTSLSFSLFFGPRFIRTLFALKVGQPIALRGDAVILAELHKNKKNTPTMGGILMIAATLTSLVLWMDLANACTGILFLTMTILGTLGGIDDFFKLYYKNSKGLSAARKLFIQITWALFVIIYLHCSDTTVQDFSQNSTPLLSIQEFSRQLYLPFMKEPLYIFSGFGLIALWAFFVFVIVGASNAVNLTDGLDGLACGSVAFAIIPFALFAWASSNQEIAEQLHIAYMHDSGEIAVFLAALFGSCLGFLRFNSHPAKVFMGDIGSLSLGGILGVSSVLLGQTLLLGLVGGIFVIEAISVIIQVTVFRLRNKRRFFLCAPLHHHFEYKGWKETTVVIRFWIIGAILSIIGIVSLK